MSKGPDSNPRLFSFVGGQRGRWRVVQQSVLRGEALKDVARIDVVAGACDHHRPVAAWTLHGVTSNERYVTQAEKDVLVGVQEDLGRPDSTMAVMIPMGKSPQWWQLPQDKRHAIFHRSHHNRIGLRFLPAIARRLHHCRDLQTVEPFDFVTWFEFAASDASAFDELMSQLRASEEWEYVDRESEFRMVLDAPSTNAG